MALSRSEERHSTGPHVPDRRSRSVSVKMIAMHGEANSHYGPSSPDRRCGLPFAEGSTIQTVIRLGRTAVSII
jgi:hypothetical protein